MKRRDLLRHLELNGCAFVSEGGSHTIWENRELKVKASISRHREITDFTASQICKQLGIPLPSKS